MLEIFNAISTKHLRIWERGEKKENRYAKKKKKKTTITPRKWQETAVEREIYI